MSLVIAPQLLGPAQGQTTDPEFNNVKLLLPFEVNLRDVSKNQQVVTPVNGTAINTGVSKFGGGSAAFSGGSYINVTYVSDFNLGNVNFTWEFWVNVPSVTRQFLLAAGNNDQYSYQIEFPANGAIAFYGTSGVGSLTTPTSLVQTNVWFHLAVVRNGTTIKIYYNGVEQASLDVGTNSFGTGNGPLQIGVVNDSSFPLNGYINDVRFTRGVARYTSNFTPPTQAFPTA